MLILVQIENYHANYIIFLDLFNKEEGRRKKEEERRKKEGGKSEWRLKTQGIINTL
ncbi:hypothetical protein [Okeania sp. KiyG1]|uniref:hypothetical protein n=1 Tax=Okeania sp. KiyG1 TaxID=2720165 RepID=UPI0019233FD2|nr:hypothetical protein [Okeania sp. KiyG1]